MAQVMRSRALGAVTIVCLLAIWQVSALYLVQSPAFPTITEIAVNLYDALISGRIPTAFVSTLQRMALGFALAAIVGVVLGLLMANSRLFYNAFEPLLELVRPIPIPSLVPLAVLFLGIGDEMKIVLVFFGAIFPILLNTYSGANSVDRTMIETAKTLQLSRWEILSKVVFPASLPSILTGMRISLALSLIISVVAEMIAGDSGAGYFILSSQQRLHVLDMYAGIISLGILGFLLNAGFMRLELRLVGSWAPTALRS